MTVFVLVWSIMVQPFCLQVTPKLPISEISPEVGLGSCQGWGGTIYFDVFGAVIPIASLHRTTLSLCSNSGGNLYQTTNGLLEAELGTPSCSH